MASATDILICLKGKISHLKNDHSNSFRKRERSRKIISIYMKTFHMCIKKIIDGDPYVKLVWQIAQLIVKML